MLNLTLYTPDRKVFEKLAVSEVTLPTAEGEIQILDGHTSFIGLLKTGPLSVHSVEQGVLLGVASSGFFEVRGDEAQRELVVCASTLELASEIDLSRAKNAQAKAEEELRDPSLSESHFKKYQLKLDRAVIRQQVANRRQ